jgi:CRISPR-associated protein Csm4
MPVLQPYYLAFRGGLHIGTRGVNLEEAAMHLPSDTLFAALLDAWRRAGGDAASFAAPFVTDAPDPPFLLTSAFPFAGGVRFYPMPADLARLFKAATIRDRGKALKHIRYLSEALLRKALQGSPLDDDLFPEDQRAEPVGGVALQGGSYWLAEDETPALPDGLRRDPGRRHALRYLAVANPERVPRVTVDRISSSSTIYHAGRLTFAPGCGLWFGVWFPGGDRSLAPDGPTFSEAMGRLLQMLAEEGLGGERASGYGAFTMKAGSPAIVLPDPVAGELALLLSRYHPRAAELPGALAAPDAAYRLAAVAGWLRSPDGAAQRRKRLYLVEEGSLVCPPAYPAGDVTDVRPTYENPAGDVPHPVYRYGLALAAGWTRRQEVSDA